jgi:tyrosine-protein phosphatase YwqE
MKKSELKALIQETVAEVSSEQHYAKKRAEFAATADEKKLIDTILNDAHNRTFRKNALDELLRRKQAEIESLQQTVREKSGFLNSEF